MKSLMTASRLIPLPIHGALELVVGLTAMVASYGLGFSPAGMVIGFFVGAAIVGLALGSTPDARGVPALAVSTHHAADYGLALGLGASALLLAIVGDTLAGLVLGGVAVTHMLLNLSTRYTARA